MADVGNLLAQFGNRGGLLSRIEDYKAKQVGNRINQFKLQQGQEEAMRGNQLRQAYGAAVGGDEAAMQQVAAVDPQFHLDLQSKLSTMSDSQRKQLMAEAEQTGRLAYMVKDDPQAWQQNFPNVPYGQKDQFLARHAALSENLFKTMNPQQGSEPAPYYSFIPGEGGALYRADARSGEITPATLPGGGAPVVSAKYDPGTRGAVKAAETTGAEFAKNQETWRANVPKLQMNISAIKARNNVVKQTIKEARPLLTKWATSYGGLISALPATKAKRLRNLLDTIKANIGFAELQAMRAASPTGGALGQVSNFENELLQAVLGSLDQTGDLNDLSRVFDQIIAERDASVSRLEDAFKQDKVRYSGQGYFNVPEAQMLPGEGGAPPAAPDMTGARVAPDGRTYVPDPNRPGGWLLVED